MMSCFDGSSVSIVIFILGVEVGTIVHHTFKIIWKAKLGDCPLPTLASLGKLNLVAFYNIFKMDLHIFVSVCPFLGVFNAYCVIELMLNDLRVHTHLRVKGQPLKIGIW